MGEKKMPRYLVIGGRKFVPAVFRVESFDENGRPERLVHIPDERQVELSRESKDNHSLIVYASEKTIGPDPALANHGSDL